MPSKMTTHGDLATRWQTSAERIACHDSKGQNRSLGLIKVVLSLAPPIQSFDRYLFVQYRTRVSVFCFALCRAKIETRDV